MRLNERQILRYLYRIFSIIPVLLITSCFTESQDQPQNEILWDKYGVPHITGTSLSDMYFEFGWAQMESHADLMLHLYGEARGRAAEYWGQDFLESDRRIWLYNIPEQAKTNYGNMDPMYRPYLDAFVSGVNRFAEKNPSEIGENVRMVLPVTAEDVVAHVLRVMCVEFIGSEDFYRISSLASAGSNAIAVGPSRSESGNTLLLTNPHLPWSNFFLWFEAHLMAKDFNAYGVSLVGMPTLSMAFNDRLGWALTVNTFDGSDRYELTLENGGYLLDGNIREFETRTHEFSILQPDKQIRNVQVTYKRTVHGPVIEPDKNRAYALRLVGMENARIFEQFHRMAAASGLNGFEEALKMMQLPMFNIIYADQSGNILYLFNGNVPVRPTGDFAFWKGTMDGSKKDLIWNSIHDYTDLPRVLNPPGGFIQNCNDPPWTCTFPGVLDPAEFPQYMAPEFMHLRAQRATNMIIDDFSVSLDDLVSYKLNTGVESAERLLDDLLAAASGTRDTLLLEAVRVLGRWDKKTDAGSRGAVLFTNWFDRLKPSMFAEKWDPSRPHSTPDGLNDDQTAMRLLREAALDVLERYDSLDITWGTVHRFRMQERDLPANGGPERYGIFRTIDYMEAPDHKRMAISGDTYVAVIEFGEKVKADVLLSYGNASQLGNPHRGDQLDLLAGKKLRPALLDRADILSNLEKREMLPLP